MDLSGLGPDDSRKATLNPSPCPAKPGKGEKGIPEKWETDSGDENRTQNLPFSQVSSCLPGSCGISAPFHHDAQRASRPELLGGGSPIVSAVNFHSGFRTKY